jgi:hypothetical protein
MQSSAPGLIARIDRLCARHYRLIVGLLVTSALVAFVMACLPRPPQLPGAPTDKVQHILAFAVLTILASAAWPGRAMAIFAGLAVYGAAIEFVQLIPALHRSGDWRDWFADVGAVAITLAVVALVRRVAATKPTYPSPLA